MSSVPAADTAIEETAMSNVNIFQNSAKTIPESDEQIIRVGMKQIDIGGRTSHLPGQEKSPAMNISHVPNAGTMTGSK
jgi:hypothetical protein